MWKPAERFYELTEPKTSLYKILLKMWVQADRIPIDQQNKLQTILFRKPSDRQNVLNVKLGHPYSFKKVFPTAKHFEFKEYVQHSKTTTATLENLLRNTTYRIYLLSPWVIWKWGHT